jgi:hypothetical protein
MSDPIDALAPASLARRRFLEVAASLPLATAAGAIHAPAAARQERPQERPGTMKRCCPIVELRQYTLHDGKRDALIELFDREFVETQELVGMTVIGQFRDLDDPNRFVWLRGFGDMVSRGASLSTFYGGPVWRAHRQSANATMVDSDNVLLLHPLEPEGGFDLSGAVRAGPATRNLITATIQYLEGECAAPFVEYYRKQMVPRMMAAGAPPIATFATDSSPNSFPPLPLRERENVLIWFQHHWGELAHRDYIDRLRAAGDWRGSASPDILRQFMRRPEVLRLAPTSRSLLR